jgi:hypothetical protein
VLGDDPERGPFAASPEREHLRSALTKIIARLTGDPVPDQASAR